jgi:hypothetical protein
MQSSSGVEVEVRLAGAPSSSAQRVGFFKGSPASSIRSAMAKALGVPDGVGLVARDADGNVVALSDRLPNGMSLTVEAVDQLAPPPSSSQSSAPAPGLLAAAAEGSLVGSFAETLAASVRELAGQPERQSRNSAFRGQVRCFSSHYRG